jgi:hypothetical protein
MMTDRFEKLFAELRADTVREIRPPGPHQVRRTVRRRQGIGASAGAVLAVGAIASGIALTGGHSPNAAPVSGPSEPPPSGLPFVDPIPSPGPEASRMDAAYAALDPKLPDVMGTQGVVSGNYENDAVELPADDYELFVSCFGPGTADLVLKAGNRGDNKVLAGRVTCSEPAVPARFAFTQPVQSRMRLFLSADEQADGKAGFAFKFIRKADLPTPPAAASTANAKVAAQALAGAGVPDAKKVTTEANKTLDVPRRAGDYLASFACAGPGTVSFIIRSAPVLRDGTVATVNSTTHTAVSYECTAAGKVTKDVAMSLPAGSAFTITAEADAAARNKAGWAYSFRAG